jgi:hypothetical protein
MRLLLFLFCFFIVSCGDSDVVSPDNLDNGVQQNDATRGDISIGIDLLPPEFDMNADIQRDGEDIAPTDLSQTDLTIPDESVTEDLGTADQLDQGSGGDSDLAETFEAPEDMLLPVEDTSGDVMIPVDELTEYNGDFWVDLSASSPFPLSDSCEGDSTLFVDPESSPVIQGEGDCSFSGAMAFFFAGSYGGTMEGDYVTSSDLEGTVFFSLDGFDIVEPWWGTDYGDRLVGEFEGDIEYEDATLGTISATYSGGFEVYP